MVGTLGLLDLAAARGLIEARTVITKLEALDFRIDPRLLDDLLNKHPGGQKSS